MSVMVPTSLLLLLLLPATYGQTQTLDLIQTSPTPSSPAFPSITGDTNPTGDPPKSSIWKYVAIAVLILLAICCFLRFLFLYLRKREKSAPPSRRSLEAALSTAEQNLATLPPYRPHARSEDGSLEAAERRRLRQQNDEIRRALEAAGLVSPPLPSRSRRSAGSSSGDNGEAERERERARVARRRERRRRIKREEEEGAGLPMYTRTKGEGEIVIEEGTRVKDEDEDDSETDSEDEEVSRPGSGVPMFFSRFGGP